MAYQDLGLALARVREEITRVQAAAGLGHPVTIIGVTKGHPADAIRAAEAAGLTDVGENRVQEAMDKQELAVGARVRWHLIGHLQTNKARFVPGAFALVHSVDSWRLARAIAEAAEKKGLRQPVLLQVNLAGETQKSGCAPAEAKDLAQQIAGEGRLELRGLMTMAPFTGDTAVQRRTFGGLRELRDRLAGPDLPLPELSMGMSGDYPSAVAEGATMLRLGTILFGERQ